MLQRLKPGPLESLNVGAKAPTRKPNKSLSIERTCVATITLFPMRSTIQGKNDAQERSKGANRVAPLLDSAPSDSPDDSWQVLTLPPSRLGGTAFGDFGGRSCCPFRSGLRSSSDLRPGYFWLPHLYQERPQHSIRARKRSNSESRRDTLRIVGPFPRIRLHGSNPISLKKAVNAK